jgi:predicted fused transcriptional regulator/phosphomethylpyrimidine kinase
MTDQERKDLLLQLESAASLLAASIHPDLIPEAGSNIGYARKGARDSNDVAAVSGRIRRHQGTIQPIGPVAFGADEDLARIVLTAMKFDPEIRSAAVIRYDPCTIRICEDLFFEICQFDRGQEPPGIRTMEWGTASCCKDGIPDVIYDRGAVGKEAMIRILGENPLVVANNIIKVSARMM